MNEEDDVVQHLMSMLGNKKEVQIKSKNGKTLKLSLEEMTGNLQNELSLGNTGHSQQQRINFQKSLLQEEFTAPEITPVKNKKISLGNKVKSKPANEAVINFINGQEKINLNNNHSRASECIKFLKQNHPQQKEQLEIISNRMIELQKVQMDKLKLDEEISSILSSSFSNSFRYEKSKDYSILSISNQFGINDPLCQLFSNYLQKTSVTKKSQANKMPSFLFLYSQPMIDTRQNAINEQINYFEEENIIQKILKQCKIDYIREQATIEKFHYWIKQNISILHFCGHGVQDKENYLLFQSHSGLSIKMNSQKLETLLSQLQNPLELVFVASCHSQTTGKIFKEAGAVHVICIRDNYEILDEACQEFAKIFYHSCINNKMTICEAFTFAKKQISLSQKFTKHECAKFIMIKTHGQDCCKSQLDILKQGDFHDLTTKPYYRKNLPSRVQNFIPRPRDLHEILKLLYLKNRFITILGYSGIGKSTLARQLVRYVQFRNMFKDGVIYLDIRSCQKMLKIFETMSMQLFDGLQVKFNKTFQQNAQKIIKELFEKNVLIVFDNCQNILSSEGKEEFKKLIQFIMKNCDNVFFVFTNRHSLGRQIDYCSQKVYQLGKLNNSQAQTLFFQRAPRNIDKKELEDFFRIQECKDYTKHPFFEFLNGHPEAICMTASLLSERSLNQLYQLLMKPHMNLTNELKKQKMEEDNMGINPLVETAMKISLNVLRNKHKDASQMIKTLSLLPVGADSETMAKLFGAKWKDTIKKLIHHSLVHCKDAGGPKYYSVHPHIIIYVQSQIGHEQKLKIHQKISQQFLKRIEKIYKFVGTLSTSNQRAQEQFLIQQENYKSIIFRQLSYYGDKGKIRRLYNNLFENEFSDDENMMEEQDLIDIKGQAVEGIRKKIVYNEKILQPTKKESISLLLVYYVTILFVTKNPTCLQFIDYGIFLSRKKKKLIVEANLLRIKACSYFIKNKYILAFQFFLKSWELYAIQGCGLGSASCEGAIGYIRFIEEEYAMAKKNLQNALKYYDQIPHSFGKHYLNRWLCSLKSKINRAQKQLMSHRQEAEKLLKGTKVSLRSNSIHNTQIIKHKLGIFVFRFTFDNISLFLQASFEVDVKPRIINEPVLKKVVDGKVLEDVCYNFDEEQMHLVHKKNFPKK